MKGSSLETETYIFARLYVSLFDFGTGKQSGSESGMNNPDHISESLEIIFWGVKILKFFYADPGWKNSDLGSGNRDKHPGSASCNADER